MTTAPRHLLVIGIGAGDPDHLTLAAVKAMRRADVFFVLDKGREKSALTRLRRDILDAHVPGPYRVVEAEDPWRDRTQDERAGYTAAVRDWRRRRADVCERLIREELAPGQCGAFLVWGDPALYDSTLAVLDDIKARGAVAFGHEVIPGISSVSALAARHRIGLNRVGRPIHITPGRRLAESLPNDDGDIVVMLDAHETFQHVRGAGTWIYWGAYLGTPDEILIAGPLDEVADRIRRVRAEARARHGWIMDTYLLRIHPEEIGAGTGAGAVDASGENQHEEDGLHTRRSGAERAQGRVDGGQYAEHGQGLGVDAPFGDLREHHAQHEDEEYAEDERRRVGRGRGALPRGA